MVWILLGNKNTRTAELSDKAQRCHLRLGRGQRATTSTLVVSAQQVETEKNRLLSQTCPVTCFVFVLLVSACLSLVDVLSTYCPRMFLVYVFSVANLCTLCLFSAFRLGLCLLSMSLFISYSRLPFTCVRLCCLFVVSCLSVFLFFMSMPIVCLCLVYVLSMYCLCLCLCLCFLFLFSVLCLCYVYIYV